MVGIVHLRVHSDYSLSEGASKIRDLLAAAGKAGVPALALTDKDNLFGALEFSKQAYGEGVQPIIGCDLSMEYDSGKFGNFVLLAQNETGYKNVCAIVKGAHERRDNGKGQFITPGIPNVTAETLEKHAEGVIFLTGESQNGLIPSLIKRNETIADETLQWLLSIFGDRLYIEICRTGFENAEDLALEEKLIGLAYRKDRPVVCSDGQVRSDVPLVATTDVWYATPDRHEPWLLLKAINSKQVVTINDDGVVNADPRRYHIRSDSEFTELFKDIPEAIENTRNIARRSAFKVYGRDPVLPAFPCEDGRTEDEELGIQALEGLKIRLKELGLAEDEKEYHDRLAYELEVIKSMGFPGYFLIVSDFIKWSKSQGIAVGPGRGSGAGSIVAWALTITDLNPLEYGLLFERFLNPERVSMPDFDIDFCMDRRMEVVHYVQDKYGSEMVSMIATFGEIKSKSALKDAGRVMVHEREGVFDYGSINTLTKLIPDPPGDFKNLQEVFENVSEFRQLISSSPKLQVLYERAKSIEGLYQVASAHAAGVIIGDRPLVEMLPVLWSDSNNMPVCSFNMKGAETVGMVKFDFLGLTTLSVIQEALKHIKTHQGIDVDLSKIDRYDKEVFKKFSMGQTTGVFQFEGAGMRKVLRSVLPTRFEDLIAVNALFRPGPMDYIELYAQRKNGEVETEYPQPAAKTEPFLSETYGIMVYQEQVMQVAQACAGYSLGGADLLRRAMGKKIPAEMEKQRNIFINGDEEGGTPGAVALGMDPKTASELFDDIAKFAGYGFNKSHAAAYAWIAYQTMWLKVHYPVEFFSALMTYSAHKPLKLALIKDELDQMKVGLLPPDINASFSRFTPEKTKEGVYAVRFGLGALKQISGPLNELVEARKQGPFSSLEDFHLRLSSFGSDQLRVLAEAGAFDTICDTRRQAADVLAWLSKRKSKVAAQQTDLFGENVVLTVPQEIKDVAEWGDVSDREFNSAGFYFAAHPIDPYINKLISAGVRRKMSIQAYMVDNNVADLNNRKLCVMVDFVNQRATARGTPYVEAIVSERGDTYRIACYDNQRRTGFNLDDFRTILEGAKTCRQPVIFGASFALDKSGEGVWINGQSVWSIEEYLQDIHGDLYITLNPAEIRPTAADIAELGKLEQTQPDHQKMFNRLLSGVDLSLACSPETIALMKGVMEDMIARKRAAIIDLISALGKGNDGGAPTKAFLRINGSQEQISDNIRLNPALTGTLKQMDGVTSIAESITPMTKRPKLSA
ncbi:DNA polymerase III subunit alpha [Thalassospira xiamenensis]|uniref:DNA polymerase III subunit alpha n=1 Tax=Thalassospira xiamenensis TaxID=220697 RepID=A0A285TXV7_9PROT|nr:DNA polymerase III subunit alpha [Thalassospira xiamenensis]SOC27171.1 DNA polymerase-3 subunit alpha [Thalassospira xiamenensis]